jgi:hypothetical protein
MYIDTRASWSGILLPTLLASAYSTNDASYFRACRCITHLSKAALSTVPVRYQLLLTSNEMGVAVQKNA